MKKRKKKWQKENEVECVKAALGNSDNFAAMDLDVQQNLPAYAAWIAKATKTVRPTQLRRFYTHVKVLCRKARDEDTGSLDPRTKAKLKFLLPKLAGTVKKKEEGLLNLYEVFALCIQTHNKIRCKADLDSFVDFFEAILDYHETVQ